MTDDKISFKERVRESAIINAKLYKDIFTNYEYLIISEAFKKKYYIIRADENNYLHLLGINTKLSPKEFFDKCINGSLSEIDFDFNKRGKPEKSVKGSVREKIKVISDFCNIFNSVFYCQEKFIKGKIQCDFASSKDSFTVGFVNSGRPKTLMKNNQLTENAEQVLAVFKKSRIEYFFNEAILGNPNLEICQKVLSIVNSQIEKSIDDYEPEL
jgi:hypothetical protein